MSQAAFLLFAFLFASTACNDLTVIMPTFKKSNFKGVESVRLNEDGKFVVSWTQNPEAKGKNRIYDIYLQRIPVGEATDTSLALTDVVTESVTFPDVNTRNAHQTLAAKKSPHSLEENRVGKAVDSGEFIFEEKIDPSMHYVFEVVENENLSYRNRKSTVVQASASFTAIAAVNVKAETSSLNFSWTDVGGAIKYEIFADRTSTRSLGFTGNSNFALSDFKAGQEICIRPERGSFVANNCFLVDDLTQSTLISKIVTDEGIFGLGTVLNFKVEFSGLVDVDSTIDLPLGSSDRMAQCVGGKGLLAIECIYAVKAGDNFESLKLGPFPYGSIRDTKGLNIPSVIPRSYVSPNIIVDTKAPSSPSSVGFNASATASAVIVSFAESEDLHFNQHRVRLCQNIDCSTACLTEMAVNHSPVKFTNVGGGTFHACVMGEDLAGNRSDWIPSTTTISTDSIPPSILNVTSTKANGSYGVGQTIDIAVKFSETVYLTQENLFALKLETGTIDRDAAYVSGAASDTLLFSYTVQAGDHSLDLNYSSTSALTLATGTIRDAAGNNATLTLPDLLTAASLGGSKAIVIDSIPPALPLAVTVPSGTISGLSVNTTWTNNADADSYNVKLCTSNNCSTGCLTQTSTATSPKTLSGVDGATLFACVQAADDAGNLSAWAPSSSAVTLDATLPTISNVSSSTADGSYKLNQLIAIKVHFSENVTVTGSTDLGLWLETGATDRKATYSSGSGSQDLIFSYTVAAGDTSSDLDFNGINAFVLGATGHVRDSALNDANLALPAVGGTSSIAGQSAIIIDTTAPAAPTLPNFASITINPSTSVNLLWTNGTDTNFRYHNAKLCSANDCSTSCISPVTSISTPALLVGVNAATYYGCVQSEDTAGNVSAWVPTPSTITIDTSIPSVTNVSSSTADGSYKLGQTLDVTVVFSSLVNVIDAGNITLTLETGATDRTATYVSGTGTDTLRFAYTVQAGDTSSDLENASSSALVLGSGSSIRSPSSANASLALPSTGSNSLSGQKALIIDTTLPANASSVGFAGTTSQTAALSMTFSNSTDTNFRYHHAKLCPTNDCSTSCLTEVTSVSTPASLTGVNGATYYGCVQGEDTAGNLSSWIASLNTVQIDTSVPTITKVSSSLADGVYKVGQIVPILVEFSENVNVTSNGTIGLTLETGTTDRVAAYASGSGSNTLTFQYIVQANDTSADLNYVGISSLAIAAGESIQDGAGNNASLTLPAIGNNASLALQNAIVIDTTAPTAPSAVNFGSATSSSLTFSMNWTNSSDTNFATHNVKLCAANDCSTTCTTPATSNASPSSMTGVNGATYYGCVQGQDLAGNLSSWIASSASIKVDTTPPTVTNVTSSLPDGAYKAGQLVPIRIQFSEIVDVVSTGTVGISLETGATDRVAIYSSGSGSNTLVFNYTVQATDTTADLDYLSTTSLSLGAGESIKDGAGNNATLTLPALGAGSSLAYQKAIVIDTTAPSLPTPVSFVGPTSTSLTFPMSWNLSTDSNFLTHNTKLCLANDCSTSCTTAASSATSPLTMTGVNGATYYGCVQGQDTAGNLSAWVSSAASIRVDTSVPTVIKVSSTIADGSYKLNQLVPITIQFSETVNVAGTGAIGLTLETGATDEVATYASGSGTDTLTFNYTVQAGDTSAELNYWDTASLVKAAGRTITDAAGNNADLTLPALNAPASLAGQTTLVIDTTLPTAPTTPSFAVTNSSSTTFNLSWTNSSDTNFRYHNAKLCAASDCSTTCLTAITSVSTPGAMTGANGSTYFGCVQGEDTAGNLSAWIPTAASISVDTTAPSVINVTSTLGDGWYKVGQLVPITIKFSEIVTVVSSGTIGLTLETGSTDRVALYSTGTGSDTLTFNYTVQAGDTAADLNYVATTSLAKAAGESIKDAAGNNASLTLPILTDPGSLATQKAIVIDTTNPSLPASVAFPAATSTSLTFNMSWTNSADTNFTTHNIKMCAANDCSTTCTTPSTSNSSPALMTGVNGSTYFGCVQGLDLAGNVSNWVASAASIKVDTTPPTVTSVSSSLPDGAYKIGQVVPITVQFSEIVNVVSSGTIGLTLETGATDRVASYSTGNGSNTLIFNYTVQSTDTSADLDYVSTGALALGAGESIKDVAGNNATLTLPAIGAANSLAFQKAIVIDTTNPTSASSVGFAGTTSTSLTFPMSWALSTDTNFSTHNAKLCLANDCTTTCTTAITSATSPLTMTGVNGSTYFGCVQGQDTAGNLSAWVSSTASIRVDTTAPTVTSVSSTLADGAYKLNQLVPITIQFSEVVTVVSTGTIGLTLETGTTDQIATYSAGSGTNTLTFNYTVQAGDTSADLNYVATTSLAKAAGESIKDAAGNNAVLTLPALAAGTSIAGQKAIVIDTTAPTAPLTPTFAVANSSSTTFNLSWTNSSDTNFRYHNAKLCAANDCSTTCLTAITSVSTPGAMTGANGSTYYGCVQGEDTAGNLSNWISTASTIRVDTTAPTVTNVSSTLADGWYKVGQLVPITIQFSEVVNVVSAGTIGLTLETGTTDQVALYSSGTGTNTLTFNYTVQAGDTAADLNYVATTSLAKFTLGESIRDAAGNNASFTLPLLNDPASLGTQKALVIDTTTPAAPTTVAFGTSLSASPTFNMTWVNSTDSSFRYHNAKLCTANDCSTSCTTAITSVSTPASMTGVDGTTYYGCVQGEDKAGNLSLWIASTGTIKVDASPPFITQVSSTLANGNYKLGQVVPITIQFSEIVTVVSSGTIALTLETGAVDRTAIYSTGTGSNTLTFNYTVQANDTSADLAYVATTSLTKAAGESIKDAAGNNADLTLPAVSGAGSLDLAKDLVIDTTNPSGPTSVGFASATNNTGTFNMSWSNSTDTNFRYHNAKLCTANDCTTGCTTALTSVSTPASMSGTNGSTYYGCVQGQDLAGNISSWVPSTTTIKVDTAAPLITNVSSTTANGYFKATQTILVSVLFNEVVTVTNSGLLGLTLETGTTDRVATYSSGTGSNTLVFSYTVQAGDISPDLEYVATSSLSVGASGTIRDGANNDANLTLPALNSASSLAGQKALVVDTTNPTNPSAFTYSSNPTSTTTVTMNFTNSTDTNFSTHNVKLCAANDCSTSCVGATTSNASPANVIGVNQTTYWGCAQGVDLAGNTGAWTAASATVKVGPTFTGVASGQYLGSWNDGSGKLELTLLAAPAGVAQYRIFYSSSSSIGTFNFATPLATITAGDATYDSNATDTKILVPVPIASVADGYYVVRFYDSTGTITDPNTAVSSLVNVLAAHPGYALIPRAFSKLAYDYYMMKYEASLSSGTSGTDTIDATEANRATCNYQFHVNGVGFHSSCGTTTSTKKAQSASGVSAAVSLTYDKAFASCRLASDTSAVVRLPTHEEWKRATQWIGTSYSTMWTTYSDGTGSNCNVSSGSAATTGSASACKSPLGLFDVAGNVSEWVDTRMSRYTVTAGETRFSYAPSMQRQFANGIDNVTRRFHFLDTGAAAEFAMAEGADFKTPALADMKQYGTDVQKYLTTATSDTAVGFRCIGFNTNSLPTMDALSLPAEPVYTASDYSGAPSTWSIPENFYQKDNKWENVAVTTTGNITTGSIAIDWTPWSKTVCNPSCTSSSAGLVYKLFRFTEPNRVSTRVSPFWALSGAGSEYTGDKPIDPLATDATGARLYTASTTDGKLIATISNCVTATPANCNFTDNTSAGTGFSGMRIYNYAITVEDAAGNVVVPLVQRYRSPYFVGAPAITGIPAFRLEERLRRASVFLVDETYQQAQTYSQIMVHVPMNKSGFDHDFFVHKYEASGDGGTQVDSNTDWPYSNSATWSSNPAVCEDTAQRTGSLGGTCLATIGGQSSTTWKLQSKQGSGPASWSSNSSYFKGCKSATIWDGVANYNLHQLTDTEFWKAADWGDVNQDGTIDQNVFTGAVLVTSIEGGTSDNTTIRCHTDANPNYYAYPSNSSQTANCRSRYGAADMVGNFQESVNSAFYNHIPLDNGVDGLLYGTAIRTSTATSGYTIDPLMGAMKVSAAATFFNSDDGYYYGGGDPLQSAYRGGGFEWGSGAGRNAWSNDNGRYINQQYGTTRCGF